MIVAGILLATVLWLLIYRLKDRFMQAYGAFFLVLLFFVVNKGSLNELNFFSQDASSPISLLRWLTLCVLVMVSLRMRKPGSLRVDVPLAALASLFLLDIMLSTLYAEDLSYSLMRAISFVLMAVAIFSGFVFFLHLRTNCLKFFRLHYYTALCLFPAAMLLHLTGLHEYGAAVVMGQYAGPFNNQNLFGIFSALATPYVLFHWRAEAMTRWQWYLDAGLLTVILTGLWLSNSRGGMLATLIAVSSYFFIVNLESRLKIIALAVCAVVIFTAFPKLQSNITLFIRKDTVERAEVKDVTQQFYEERRYSMWSGVFPLYWKEKLTGYGFATSHLLIFPFSGDKEVGRHVHNSYLELFGDLGLPGIMLLLLILLRLTWCATGLVQRDENYLQRNINATFISIFLAGATNAFFESWMFSVGNIISLVFWGPLAGVFAQWAYRPVRIRDQGKLASIACEFGYHAWQPQEK